MEYCSVPPKMMQFFLIIMFHLDFYLLAGGSPIVTLCFRAPLRVAGGEAAEAARTTQLT